jgi:hypothetical protein
VHPRGDFEAEMDRLAADGWEPMPITGTTSYAFTTAVPGIGVSDPSHPNAPKRAQRAAPARANHAAGPGAAPLFRCFLRRG